VFDNQLKWMFPSRVDAHKKLDTLLNLIDIMVDDKRREVFQLINTPEYQSKPTAEKDILTLMLEAEREGEGKLSNEELSVCKKK
jgi:cytochrome P450